MPNEFAQELGELDFVIIEGSDGALGPMVREAGEEMLEVEGFHFRVGYGSSKQARSLLGLAIVELQDHLNIKPCKP